MRGTQPRISCAAAAPLVLLSLAVLGARPPAALAFPPAPPRGHPRPLSASADSADADADADGIRLTSLLRYPVKSCGAEPLAEAEVTPEGLAGDRRFLIARRDGSHLTQREVPGLAALEARTEGGGGRELLRLSLGGDSVRAEVRRSGPLTDASLFGTRLRLADQGDEVGRWLAGALGPPPDAEGGGGLASFLERRLLGAPPYRLLRAPDRPRPSPPLRAGAGLGDLAPLLLISEESLAALNERRAGRGLDPVPMARFRPNLVVGGCGEAHAEDRWRSLALGEARFRVLGPCPRCTVPDVEQKSGRRDPAGDGPMAMLGEYRIRPGLGVVFGVYLEPLNPGAIVRVGDKAVVEAA